MSLVTIHEASKWATDYLEKEVSPTNISYLVQYGKVKKLGENGSTLVDLNDLKKYLPIMGKVNERLIGKNNLAMI